MVLSKIRSILIYFSRGARCHVAASTTNESLIDSLIQPRTLSGTLRSSGSGSAPCDAGAHAMWPLGRRRRRNKDGKRKWRWRSASLLGAGCRVASVYTFLLHFLQQAQIGSRTQELASYYQTHTHAHTAVLDINDHMLRAVWEKCTLRPPETCRQLFKPLTVKFLVHILQLRNLWLLMREQQIPVGPLRTWPQHFEISAISLSHRES